MRKAWVILTAACLAGAAWAAEPASQGAVFWPQWRGPEATGVSRQADPPLTWSDTENIRWKVAIPGRGHSTPIVWNDRVFVLTAVPVGEPAAAAAGEGAADAPQGVAPDHVLRFVVLALAREDGRVLWEQTAVEGKPHEGTHPDGTWASSSPVTDGERVYAFFGSRGLYAYDLDGKLLWQRDFGDMETRRGFGEGSSPAIWGDFLVINWDHEGESFITAVDKRSGEPRWKVERDEITSWSTPLIVAAEGDPQVVVSATGRTRGYDLASGRVLWEVGGMTVNVVPSPVYGNGLVYVTSGFRGNALQAIRLAAAKGDLTGSPAIAWSHDQHTPYVPSPLLYDDKLYFVKTNSGILSCLDAVSGQVHYTEQRIDDVQGVYASPVGASDRVYLAGRNGVTTVIRHGPKYEVLAVNRMDDSFDASPAIVGNELYLRGRQHLYCLTQKTPPQPAATSKAAAR